MDRIKSVIIKGKQIVKKFYSWYIPIIVITMGIICMAKSILTGICICVGAVPLLPVVYKKLPEIPQKKKTMIIFMIVMIVLGGMFFPRR